MPITEESAGLIHAADIRADVLRDRWLQSECERVRLEEERVVMVQRIRELEDRVQVLSLEKDLAVAR
jgi:hypothetical protein